jgi:hypothetical protein
MGIKRPWTPTSTFVYTTIFAVGLAIDAKGKQRRNEQWDEAFALLREEMEKPNTRRMPPQEDMDSRPREKRRMPIMENMVYGEGISFIPTEELYPEGIDWDIVYRVAGTELSEHKVFETRQTQVDMSHISKQMWHLLAYDSRFPGAEVLEWPANTGERLTRYNLPPQSLWSTDEMRRKALSNRQTWKKQLLQELYIGGLIHGLLRPIHSMYNRLPEDALQSLSPIIQDIFAIGPLSSQQRQAEILRNIEVVQGRPIDSSFEEIASAKSFRTFPGIPRYIQDEDGDYYHICHQMNTAIKQILFGEDLAPPNETQVPLTLAKICHNLLVSSSAPDVQTFNILISGLTRWKLPDLVDGVISAFTGCKVRPNEITCVAILDHYLQTNRPEDFSKFVAKMRGVHKGGLMLANPTITINERGSKRLIRVSEDKVIQKVHPTPLVFNTLMLGALKFAGCERALEIYYEMKEDGWGLDIGSLNQFLDDCISRADWNNGVYIWNEILSIITMTKPSQKGTAYSKMLSLCSVTGNTAAFNQLLKDVVNQGLDRRFVVKSALKTAQKLHGQPGSKALPMAADNVLFAIGEYIGDAEEKKDVPEKERVDFEQNYASQQEPQQEPQQELQRDDAPARDAEADWSSWIEQELVVPVEHITTSTQDSPPVDPDEGFASWAELELHKEPDQVPDYQPDVAKDSTTVSKKAPSPKP